MHNSSLITHNSSLSFQYHYNVLPSSIISRFIVRLHAYIQAGLVWRSGVVLAYQTSQAAVRADLDERKIFISVNGESAADRRVFLAIIRSHFKAIHTTLPGLVVQEKVALPGQPHLLEDYDYLLQLEKMGETSFVPRGGTEKVSVKACLEGFVATLPEERGRGKQAQRVQLRDALSERFSKEEIRALCFDLAVPFAKLKGETPTELAMALIEYMEHRDRLLELRLKVEEARPGSLRGLEDG